MHGREIDNLVANKEQSSHVSKNKHDTSKMQSKTIIEISDSDDDDSTMAMYFPKKRSYKKKIYKKTRSS